MSKRPTITSSIPEAKSSPFLYALQEELGSMAQEDTTDYTAEVTNAAAVMDGSNYLTLTIGGVTYKVALVL